MIYGKVRAWRAGASWPATPGCCCASPATPGVRLRGIAARTGVTERTAYGIVTDLTGAGYVVRHKDGRRNRYQIQAHLPLRRPLPVPGSGGLAAVGEVLALLDGDGAGAAGLSARDEGPVIPLADGSQPGTGHD
jgi:DNA-binding IclR family transcriptional regulator